MEFMTCIFICGFAIFVWHVLLDVILTFFEHGNEFRLFLTVSLFSLSLKFDIDICIHVVRQIMIICL